MPLGNKGKEKLGSLFKKTDNGNPDPVSFVEQNNYTVEQKGAAEKKVCQEKDAGFIYQLNFQKDSIGT